jgi:hypothetical protein
MKSKNLKWNDYYLICDSKNLTKVVYAGAMTILSGKRHRFRPEPQSWYYLVDEASLEENILDITKLWDILYES